MTRIGNIAIWTVAIFAARNTSAHKLLRTRRISLMLRNNFFVILRIGSVNVY